MEDRRAERIYEVDGTSYDSIDDVPEPQRSELRRLLADADGDGVPDIVRGGSSAHVVTTTQTTRIEVDGTSYDSIDDVPEPQRSAVRRMLADQAPPSGRRDQPVATRRADSTVAGSATSPIVTSSGSSRAKLLALFVALDVVAVGVIVWLLAR